MATSMYINREPKEGQNKRRKKGEQKDNREKREHFLFLRKRQEIFYTELMHMTMDYESQKLK